MIVPLLVRVEEHEDTSSLLWLLIEDLDATITPYNGSFKVSPAQPYKAVLKPSFGPTANTFPRSPAQNPINQIGSSNDLTLAKIPGVEMFSCSSIPIVALSKLWFFN